MRTLSIATPPQLRKSMHVSRTRARIASRIVTNAVPSLDLDGEDGDKLAGGHAGEQKKDGEVAHELAGGAERVLEERKQE